MRLDPLGFLEPGEIFFQTSGRKFVMHDQSEATILLGDVLVGRSPTKLPGDVQKVSPLVSVAILVHATDCVYSVVASCGLRTTSLPAGRDRVLDERRAACGGLPRRRRL